MTGTELYELDGPVSPEISAGHNHFTDIHRNKRQF